jgi:hypothetical protein
VTTPASIGVTFACREGLDPSFRICASDEEIVIDEAWRRMTTDSVIGDTDEAANFGKNVFRECGSYLSDPQVQLLGPTYGEVLQRSPIIETADVTVTRGPSPSPMIDLVFTVAVTPINPSTGLIGDTLSFAFRLTGENFALVGNPDGGA